MPCLMILIRNLGLPGCDTVCVNLSAKEILELADEIISKSTRVHDTVALVPLNKVLEITGK